MLGYIKKTEKQNIAAIVQHIQQTNKQRTKNEKLVYTVIV